MGIKAIIITLIVCITMTTFVIIKPAISLKFIKIKGQPIKLDSYAIIALAAPIALLLLKIISFSEIWHGITSDKTINPLKILVLFFSMCFISLCLDKTGFFEFCAAKALSNAKKGQKTLFTYFFFFISLLTVFTSNDIIILTFTPFICYFCKNAKISAIPYIAALFTAANTFSLMFIIGNPTNIYIGASLGINFLEYLKFMSLPALAAGISAFIALRIIFNKSLSVSIPTSETESSANILLKDKPSAIIILLVLLACIIFMSTENYVGYPMWLISFAFAFLLALLLIIIKIIRLIKYRGQNKEILPTPVLIPAIKNLPFSIIPFLLSMFTAVLALEKHGITQKIASFLFSTSSNGIITGYIFGFLSAITSNILNNIPMSVLFSGILNYVNGPNAIYAVYASIIGSNLGALISPSGALAGIMLLNLLKRHNTGFNAKSFIKYLLPVALISLTFSVAMLAISLYLL